MQKHKINRHQVGKFPCPIDGCGKVFKWGYKLKSHMASTHKLVTANSPSTTNNKSNPLNMANPSNQNSRYKQANRHRPSANSANHNSTQSNVTQNPPPSNHNRSASSSTSNHRPATTTSNQYNRPKEDQLINSNANHMTSSLSQRPTTIDMEQFGYWNDGFRYMAFPGTTAPMQISGAM